MPRIANRPLPAGRLQPVEVLTLGDILSAGGVVFLLELCRGSHPLRAG
jgi:heme O synthase-like polyprenyltransferase